MNGSLKSAEPRKLPRQERSRALVDAIVEAAADILVRNGREALTTNAVACRAGVSIGSLYQYFANREAIIAAVAQRHNSRVRACMEAFAHDDAATLEEALNCIVAAQFAGHGVDPALHITLDGLDPTPTVALLKELPPSARNEISADRYDFATIVAARFIDSVAGVAVRHPTVALHDTLHRETVVAALNYLRAPA